MKFVNSTSKFDCWKMSSIDISDNLNIVAMECGKRRRRDCDCDCDDCVDCDCDDCYDAEDYRRRMYPDQDEYDDDFYDSDDC